MPYKFELEKLKLPPGKDRRVKLTAEQRQDIAEEYAKGNTSYNKLAQKYGVSKRLIIFVVNPQIKEACQKAFKERRKDGRYKPTKEARAATMREHRAYKCKVFKDL